MAAAILLPAAFVGFHTERFFFAVADGFDAAGADSRRHQSILYRRGTLVAKSQVVLGGTALVAVSLNRKVDVGMLTEELRVGLHRSLFRPPDLDLVISEVYF